MNGPFLTKKIIDNDPDYFDYETSSNKNSGNRLKTFGYIRYILAFDTLIKLCQRVDITQQNFEDAFKNPFTSCAQKQTIPLRVACNNANIIAVQELQRRGAIADYSIIETCLNTILHIDWGTKMLNLDKMLGCLKTVCIKNPIIRALPNLMIITQNCICQRLS